jgi:hypothetical protein
MKKYYEVVCFFTGQILKFGFLTFESAENWAYQYEESSNLPVIIQEYYR